MSVLDAEGRRVRAAERARARRVA
ncbi:hypothetical protein CQR44_1659, partial [Bifidobacterium asteroides]